MSVTSGKTLLDKPAVAPKLLKANFFNGPRRSPYQAAIAGHAPNCGRSSALRLAVVGKTTYN